MQLTATLSPLRLMTGSARRDSHRRPPATAKEQAKRAGGPQDHAFYACDCGYAFTAAVTTSVGCPHCGTNQAW